MIGRPIALDPEQSAGPGDVFGGASIEGPSDEAIAPAAAVGEAVVFEFPMNDLRLVLGGEPALERWMSVGAARRPTEAAETPRR